MLRRLGWFLLGILTSVLSITFIGLALMAVDSNWPNFTFWVGQQTFATPEIVNILQDTPDFLRYGIGFFAYVVPILLGTFGCVVTVYCSYKMFKPHVLVSSEKVGLN